MKVTKGESMDRHALKFEQIKRQGNLFRANTDKFHFYASEAVQLGYTYGLFILER